MEEYNLHKREYLCEESLGYYIRKLYPNDEIVRNKQFPKNRFRPDYTLHEQKLVIEYDGHYHYTSPKQICSDAYKADKISEQGYTLIRIPYFIQMTKETLMFYFGKKESQIPNNIEYLNFPHGFITKDCVFPAAFCTLGVQVFSDQLSNISENLPTVYNEIMFSLRDKVENEGICRAMVMPYNW